MADRVALRIDQCSKHSFWAVTLNHDNGHGLRLTPSKCCGLWDKTLIGWKLSADDLRTMAAEIAEWADELDRSNKGRTVGERVHDAGSR